MPGLKDKMISVGYGLGWSIVCRLPEAWTMGTFRFFADLAWRREGPRVQMLEANLVRILGQNVDGKALRTASRGVMRNYGRYWLEIFRLPVMPVQQLVDGMHDRENAATRILDTAAEGRGLVIALPHMGNWDQAGAWIITKGAGSFTTVMERLKPESLYERFVTFREGLGMEVLPASGGVRPFGILAQRLRAGKIVILPADRDVTGSGIEVDFFGEKAKMMAGPAALAVLTGAALLPAALWFEDDGWGVRVGAEIKPPEDGTRSEKIAAMMQDIATFFEQGIREHPHDWLMLQKVFVADLDPERQARAAARAARIGQNRTGAAQNGQAQSGQALSGPAQNGQAPGTIGSDGQRPGQDAR